MVSGLKTLGLSLLALLTVLAWTPIRVDASGAEHCRESGPVPSSGHIPSGQPDCGSPCDPGACPSNPCATLSSAPADSPATGSDDVVSVARPGRAGFQLHLHGSSPPPTPPPNSLLG
jgi:hypothetical protein